MATPFVSSLRTSLGATGSGAVVSASSAGKSAMASLFSELDLALDASGAVVAGGRSAAKDLLASKSAEKQAEAALDAERALKRQQQETQKQNQKNQPVTALSQALGLFDQELDERDAFVSRNTKRRQKGGKKARGAASTTAARGRRQRQDKYRRV
ncbi:SMG9 protein [Phytophthora cinnamomi]|uniref:SMG9 protein n=1 Tax=Phytophthora cinnamomi TaxID=4785 RepID=UPI003559D75D|nr:SMG9 protein [Phytophthora cinnamomi]